MSKFKKKKKNSWIQTEEFRSVPTVSLHNETERQGTRLLENSHYFAFLLYKNAPEMIVIPMVIKKLNVIPLKQ